MRYTSKWVAIIERDGAQDTNVFKEGDPEYHTTRSRFYRKFPPWATLLFVNSIVSSTLTSLREDWSLGH